MCNRIRLNSYSLIILNDFLSFFSLSRNDSILKKRAKRARSHFWQIIKLFYFKAKYTKAFLAQNSKLFLRPFLKFHLTSCYVEITTKFLEISRKLHLTAMTTSIIVEVAWMLSHKILNEICPYKDITRCAVTRRSLCIYQNFCFQPEVSTQEGERCYTPITL